MDIGRPTPPIQKEMIISWDPLGRIKASEFLYVSAGFAKAQRQGCLLTQRNKYFHKFWKVSRIDWGQILQMCEGRIKGGIVHPNKPIIRCTMARLQFTNCRKIYHLWKLWEAAVLRNIFWEYWGILGNIRGLTVFHGNGGCWISKAGGCHFWVTHVWIRKKPGLCFG